jgi:Fe-Mn family superoxide dismutase
MDQLISDKVKAIIQKSLVEEKQEFNSLDEAYVAQKKIFKINTDFLSNANIQNHLSLYEKYVNDFNKISAELDSLDKTNLSENHSVYRSTKSDEIFNMNAAYLHELFFANIADPASQIRMDSLSYMRIARDFGTFDDWQRDFMSCALSSRCGWAVTYLNTYTQSYMNCFIDLHSDNVPVGMIPIIVIDMWQHSYYKDYQKDAKTYLIAMMKQLRWETIEKRFEKSDKILSILRGL